MSDSRIAGINWRRGAVRLWILASVLWCAAVFSVGLINTNVTWLPPESPATVHVRISNTETRDYPAEWGVQRIRDDLQKRLDEEKRELAAQRAAFPVARQIECRAFESKPYPDVPADCNWFFYSAPNFLDLLEVPSGWESQIETALVPAWKAIAVAMPWAVGPPLVVLALGASLFWVFAGFKRE